MIQKAVQRSSELPSHHRYRCLWDLSASYLVPPHIWVSSSLHSFATFLGHFTCDSGGPRCNIGCAQQGCCLHQDFKRQSLLAEPQVQDSSPRELWAQAKNCYRATQRYGGRTSQKTSEGKTITLLGPEGRIHTTVHLEGRTPIRMGLEGTAWSQGDLKTNGNCPIGFRTFFLWEGGAVIPFFFFSISPFWSRNVYHMPAPPLCFGSI